MNGNIRRTITHCKQCNQLFSQTWPDQELCTVCKPLACDPVKLQLAQYVSRNVMVSVSTVIHRGGLLTEVLTSPGEINVVTGEVVADDGTLPF